MIRCAVIGAAGYTGGETLRLLLQHPSVDANAICALSSSHAGKLIAEAHPDLWGYTSLRFLDDTSSINDVDVVFLCMGHGKSREWMTTHEVASQVKVIDLSHDHRAIGPNSSFVYGLPERYRDQIARARHIANPGCLATSIELALLPLAKSGQLQHPVVAQTLSGSTGAGQKPVDVTHFSWRHSNVDAYKVFQHQHEAEILQTLGQIPLSFVPLRGPFARGIYATCIVQCEYRYDEVLTTYRNYYQDHPFVVVRDTPPDLKSVVNTNMCHLGIVASDSALLIISVIDNLMKGASGQAIQNMNIMFGLNETTGLLTKASAF